MIIDYEPPEKGEKIIETLEETVSTIMDTSLPHIDDSIDVYSGPAVFSEV